MEKALRTAVGTVCAYEVFALTTGRVPTVSSISRKYWPFEVIILGGLVADIHWLWLKQRIDGNKTRT